MLCEKPLASTVAEAESMIALAKQKKLANCTLYNVRSYPQVQNMRRMCEAGEFGEIYVVQGTYSQDWLLYDTDWNWRIESGTVPHLCRYRHALVRPGGACDRPAHHFAVRRSADLSQDA